MRKALFIMVLLAGFILGAGRFAASQQQAMPPEVADRLVDLSSCIDHLQKTGNLVRVKSEVDLEYDLAGIAKKYEGKKCVLFEKVKGSPYPVLIGLLWNRDIVGSIFGVPKEKVPFTIAGAIKPWRENKDAFPSPVLEKGPANEVIEKDVDLYRLPVPIHALEDGGRYFDSSVPAGGGPQLQGVEGYPRWDDPRSHQGTGTYLHPSGGLQHP